MSATLPALIVADLLLDHHTKSTPPYQLSSRLGQTSHHCILPPCLGLCQTAPIRSIAYLRDSPVLSPPHPPLTAWLTVQNRGTLLHQESSHLRQLRAQPARPARQVFRPIQQVRLLRSSFLRRLLWHTPTTCRSRHPSPCSHSHVLPRRSPVPSQARDPAAVRLRPPSDPSTSPWAIPASDGTRSGRRRTMPPAPPTAQRNENSRSIPALPRRMLRPNLSLATMSSFRPMAPTSPHPRRPRAPMQPRSPPRIP